MIIMRRMQVPDKRKINTLGFVPMPKINFRELEKSFEANRKERMEFLLFSADAVGSSGRSKRK